MDFSFVQITDHHLGESEETLLRGYSTAHAFRCVLRHIAHHVGDRIDFIVSTGDLVEPASDVTYEIAYKSLSRVLNLQASSAPPGPQIISVEGLREVPMYFLPGNHDDRSSFFTSLFSPAQPAPLMNATFQHKGVQFVCLDWGVEAKAIAFPETLDFLSLALQAPAPSIVLMHHHATPVGARWLDDFIADDVESFWQIVEGRNVLAIICGHVHITSEAYVAGIPVYTLRSTAPAFARLDNFLPTLQPPHYRLVTVQDGIVTTRVFEVHL